MIPIKDYLRSKSFPVVNSFFLLANGAVFVLQLTLPEGEAHAFVMRYGFVAERFFASPVEEALTPFTSMFLHGGFIHFAGNMLFLFVFGDNVEDALGHLRYVFFYLFAGLVAALAQGFLMRDPSVPLVGASGAISAVIGGYIVLYPAARVLALIPVGFFLMSARLPAYLFLGIWALLQFLSGWLTITGTAGTNVGYFAHIGGFLFGLVFTLLGREKYLAKFKRQRRVFYG